VPNSRPRNDLWHISCVMSCSHARSPPWPCFLVAPMEEPSTSASVATSREVKVGGAKGPPWSGGGHGVLVF
jgi:hypothetical protein